VPKQIDHGEFVKCLSTGQSVIANHSRAVPIITAVVEQTRVVWFPYVRISDIMGYGIKTIKAIVIVKIIDDT